MSEAAAKKLEQQAAGGDRGSVPAGVLPPWSIDELPEPPQTRWTDWRRFVGPGMLAAGASVAAGEWLLGPAVSGQYGGTVLWLATTSILLQLFLNIESARYALYCGEPSMVGFFRTKPGPRLWTPVYLLLETHDIWPFMAASAAVPLAAAMLGHLPGSAMTTLAGVSLSENQLVRSLGHGIFLVAFIPLIFGGAIYRMVERIMTVKLVTVLTWLTFVVVFMVSGPNLWEATSGLVRFGTVPIRAESVIDGRHFTWTEHGDSGTHTVKGTIENGRPLVTSFTADRDGTQQVYAIDDAVPRNHQSRRDELVQKAVRLAQSGRFLVEHTEGNLTLRAAASSARTARGSRTSSWSRKPAKSVATTGWLMFPSRTGRAWKPGWPIEEWNRGTWSPTS